MSGVLTKNNTGWGLYYLFWLILAYISLKQSKIKSKLSISVKSKQKFNQILAFMSGKLNQFGKKQKKI